MLFRGAGRSDPVYPDFKLDRQFRVMQCLQDTAVPVPRVHWMERDEGLFGFPFYLMSRIDGDVPSEFPPYHSFGVCRDATPEKRARMWWGTLEAMAGVHALDWKSLGLSFLGVPPDGQGALDGELDYWEHYLDWARDEPQPILEAALRWLRDHKYAPARVSLCWGDARLPNTIFGPDGEVRGLLDWDMAILSDPVSDLAFFLTLDHLLSVGTGVPRLPGFPDEEETVRRYEETDRPEGRELLLQPGLRRPPGRGRDPAGAEEPPAHGRRAAGRGPDSRQHVHPPGRRAAGAARARGRRSRRSRRARTSRARSSCTSRDPEAGTGPGVAGWHDLAPRGGGRRSRRHGHHPRRRIGPRSSAARRIPSTPGRADGSR